jgi:hypothetical protein
MRSVIKGLPAFIIVDPLQDRAVVGEHGQRVKCARTFKNDAKGVIELIHLAREIDVEQ